MNSLDNNIFKICKLEKEQNKEQRDNRWNIIKIFQVQLHSLKGKKNQITIMRKDQIQEEIKGKDLVIRKKEAWIRNILPINKSKKRVLL